MDLPTIIFEPASATHTHTVVFLHGRGDRARNFSASLAYSRDSHNRTLGEALPSFRWVFPQAPMRKRASLPDTWPQWFDVWNVNNFADREELQAVGLREVVPAIRHILEGEATRLGGHWDRLILAGISMGGATSVHTLFNLDIPTEAGGRLAAFMGFSCRLPFVGRSLVDMRKTLGLDGVPGGDDVVRSTPILLEHCIDDPLVRVQWGRDLRDALRGFGAQVEWSEYPDGGHWFNSPTGIDEVINFLKRHVLMEVNADNEPTSQSQLKSNEMDLS